jgi:hypothetical protein
MEMVMSRLWNNGNVASGVVLLLVVILSTGRAAAQAEYVTIEVADAGTIDGTVRWTGPTPKISKLPITKNADVCDPESRKTRDLERLLINSDGGVANTVVYLKDITRGKQMDLPAERQHLDQKHCRYVPHILLVPQGGPLQIRSSDPILHTVHMAGAAANNIPFPFQNQDIPVPMRRSGVVDLKCNAGHVWMNAEILVVKHPYYAITDEHGSFELTGVPAGEYEIEAWHEGWGIVREETVLDVGAQVDVRRPIYSDPRTWAKKVTVRAGQTSRVDFSISTQ